MSVAIDRISHLFHCYQLLLPMNMPVVPHMILGVVSQGQVAKQFAFAPAA